MKSRIFGQGSRSSLNCGNHTCGHADPDSEYRPIRLGGALRSPEALIVKHEMEEVRLQGPFIQARETLRPCFSTAITIALMQSVTLFGPKAFCYSYAIVREMSSDATE